ncbi:hypothetical protein B9H02_08710 [Prosthecochloris sp. HL-130-GSB]|nr:hypothetical protein B9H02_08710 [Prosthecochloris sp. HL-130-GSB]
MIFMVFVLMLNLILVSGDTNLVISPIKHAGNFLPFIAAVTVLIAPFQFKSRQVEKYIILAYFMGLTLSVVLYLYMPSVFYGLNKDNDDFYVAMTMFRRMSWSGVVATPLIIYLLSQKNKGSDLINGFLYFVISAGLMLNGSRTLIMASFVLFVGLILLRKKNILYVNYVLMLIMVFLYYVVNQNAVDLIDVERFRVDYMLSSSYEHYRLPLYEQYQKQINDNWLRGVGLGRVITHNFGGGAFYSDVSLVTFWLSLGIFGLVLILYYLAMLLRFGYGKYKIPGLLLVLITVLTAFNVDIFARSVYVIILSVFIFLCSNDDVKEDGSVDVDCED